MGQTIKIGLIGDRSEAVLAHRAIPKAIELLLPKFQADFKMEWIPTMELERNFAGVVKDISGFWCTPGSPYESMDGVLRAIRYTRESKIPLLGTCGGFQHMLIEYARNVLGVANADHQESSPAAEIKFISKLSCSLVGMKEKIFFSPRSRLAKIHSEKEFEGEFYCSYGLNPKFEERFEGTALRITGRDRMGSARGVELEDHPFFIGTLFQPELAALRGEESPLVAEFLKTMGPLE